MVVNILSCTAKAKTNSVTFGGSFLWEHKTSHLTGITRLIGPTPFVLSTLLALFLACAFL